MILFTNLSKAIFLPVNFRASVLRGGKPDTDKKASSYHFSVSTTNSTKSQVTMSTAVTRILEERPLPYGGGVVKAGA